MNELPESVSELIDPVRRRNGSDLFLDMVGQRLVVEYFCSASFKRFP